MSSTRKISIAQAFDMIPMGGYVMMKCNELDVVAEAERRNALHNGESYSVVMCVNTIGQPQGVLVTRRENWASASDEMLLNLMHFAQRLMT